MWRKVPAKMEETGRKTQSAAEEATNIELEEGKAVEVEGKRGGRERMTRQPGRGGNIGGEGNRER